MTTNHVEHILTKHGAMPIAKRGRKSIHFKQENGTVLGVFTGVPLHYLDAGEWKALDTKLVELNGEFRAPGMLPVFMPSGEILFDGKSHRQQTLGVGVLAGDVYSEMVKLPGGNAGVDRIIRESGIYTNEVILTPRGMKEQLVLAEKPANLSGELFVIETEIFSDAFKYDALKDVQDVEGMMLHKGIAWDANGDIVPVEMRLIDLPSPKKKALYWGVSVAWLDSAMYPVVIDPVLDQESDTADGNVYGSSTSYSTARATSSDFNATGTSLWCGQIYDTGGSAQYSVERVGLKFDTSSIGGAGTVDQVNLGLVAVSDRSERDFNIQIVNHDWSGQDPLSSSNREAYYDAALSLAHDVIWRNTSGMALNTVYSSPNMDTSYVNGAGNTYYSLRSDRDKNGNAPSTSPSLNGEDIGFAAAEHGTAAYRPILSVIYTPGGRNFQYAGGMI